MKLNRSWHMWELYGYAYIIEPNICVAHVITAVIALVLACAVLVCDLFIPRLAGIFNIALALDALTCALFGIYLMCAQDKLIRKYTKRLISRRDK